MNPGGSPWQQGWTHYGTVGQTLARLHTQTRAGEIKDGNEWIRCAAGADTFFTPDGEPAERPPIFGVRGRVRALE